MCSLHLPKIRVTCASGPSRRSILDSYFSMGKSKGLASDTAVDMTSFALEALMLRHVRHRHLEGRKAEDQVCCIRFTSLHWRNLIIGITMEVPWAVCEVIARFHLTPSTASHALTTPNQPQPWPHHQMPSDTVTFSLSSLSKTDVPAFAICRCLVKKRRRRKGGCAVTR
jgi:hypothetical protein